MDVYTDITAHNMCAKIEIEINADLSFYISIQLQENNNN